ncbi:MAG: alanyl-tRNA editing protein [Thaumarchaeota archaeon]|jgi:alanyl-tRNA synthetase|nr:alanyl-tRNA editing protein [Candidatus Terraquivivens yellowstonensis]MCL7398171.1 alanyl-tRNA editing protein [Candidatus Terraquivivens yellowstonensis]
MVSLAEVVAGLPETKKLYLDDSYKKEAESHVLRWIKDTGRKGYVVVRETIMHPKSGAQPSDHGVLESAGITFIVNKVMEYNGVIVHYGEISGGDFKEEDCVKLRLDWERRYKIMRTHTAGHIVDYAVVTIYGRPFQSQSAMHDVGYGFQEYIGEYSGDLKERIEEVANEVVMSNKPVFAEYVNAHELSNRVFGAPNLARLPRLDVYRIVVIEGINAIPCGGTHVKNTSEVGRIKIESIEQVGNGFKVSYRVLNG